MPETVLCSLVFLKRGNEILLAKGKCGINKGRFNGYGGKIEPTDADIKVCALRELREESGVLARRRDLDYACRIRFYWEGEILGFNISSARIIDMHVFTLDLWQGQPKETKAMGDPAWFSSQTMPYGQMHPDAKIWMPYLLEGKKFEGDFFYNANARITSCGIYIQKAFA